LHGHIISRYTYIIKTNNEFEFPHFLWAKAIFLNLCFPPLSVKCVLTFAEKRMVKILIGMFRQLAFVEGLMFCICDAGAPFSHCLKRQKSNDNCFCQARSRCWTHAAVHNEGVQNNIDL